GQTASDLHTADGRPALGASRPAFPHPRAGAAPQPHSRGMDLASASTGPGDARRDPLWLDTPRARDRPAGHQCGAATLAHSCGCSGTRPSAGTSASAADLAAASGGPTIRTRLLRRLYARLGKLLIFQRR